MTIPWASPFEGKEKARARRVLVGIRTKGLFGMILYEQR